MSNPDQQRAEAVALKEYVDAQIQHLLNRLEDQRLYSEKAVDKAEEALSKRLDGMNEFRMTLRDQAGTMATRDSIDALRERVVDTEKRIGLVAAGISILVSIAVSVLVALITKMVTK